MTRFWGIETTIDLVKCNEKAIKTREIVEKFSEQLVKFIDMKSYTNPIVIHFGSCKEVEGFTLVQLIETSLISGHFVNLTCEAYINIFSCKDYNSALAADFTKNYFEAKKMTYKRIERGSRDE